MMKYGSREGRRVVPGIAPPSPPTIPPPRVHLPTEPPSTRQRTRVLTAVNMVVGLISVDQLTLGLLFSDIRGMTEVYNLIKVRRINNHFVIPGND